MGWQSTIFTQLPQLLLTENLLVDTTVDIPSEYKNCTIKNNVANSKKPCFRNQCFFGKALINRRGQLKFVTFLSSFLHCFCKKDLNSCKQNNFVSLFIGLIPVTKLDNRSSISSLLLTVAKLFAGIETGVEGVLCLNKLNKLK